MVALVLSLAAYAVPTDLTHTGRLLDSTGMPLQGAGNVDVKLFDAITGGNEVYSATAAVTFDEGYFSVTLGGVDDSMLDGDLWIEVTANGGSPLPRLPIASVPYARMAGSVVGGVVDASELRIDGTLIADSSGFAGGSLSDLSCGADQVALYDGGSWVCANPTASWNDLSDVPLELTDGDDDALGALTCGNDELAVFLSATGWTCRTLQTQLSVAAVDLPAGSTIDSAVINEWTALANVPADIADGDADDWSEIANIPADIADGDADDWSEIANIPADIADGDADDWSEISGIPGDIADGDADDWSEIANIPADIADGDDVMPAGCGEGEVGILVDGAIVCDRVGSVANWSMDLGPTGEGVGAIPGWHMTGTTGAGLDHKASYDFDGTGYGFGADTCCSPATGSWSMNKYFRGNFDNVAWSIQVKIGNADPDNLSCGGGQEFVGEDDGRIWVYAYAGDGSLLGSFYSQRGSNARATTGDLGGGWAQLDYTDTAPAGTRVLRVELFADDENNGCFAAGYRGGANSAVYWDDFHFDTPSQPGAWSESIQPLTLPSGLP